MRDRVTPRRLTRPAVAVAVCGFLLAMPASAGAVISDVHLIDGPGDSVVDVADAAMSEDGTGGVVYLKRVGGRDHVFAVQYRDGEWRAPQRVDVGQDFDSSWPRIGAGDGGRLVVTWVQEFGVQSDRMFSATMDPGATGFQAPIPIDFNVGEATSTYPDLAMARGGQAYLVYRVVTDTSPANPPGYLGADVRLARYENRLWSVLGTPLDRNISIPVREPTEGNAPEVGIDIQGQGIVAWHEPDDEFVDRVWARRVFGTRVGIPLQVSPSSWEGVPLRGPADAFSLDISGFGQAAVAFRQQPGQASKLNAPRAMVNLIPDVFSEDAGSFGGAQPIDGQVRGGLGPPSVAVEPRGLFSAGFGSGTVSLLSEGDAFSVYGVERLDEGDSTVAGDPLIDLAESGAGVAAWRGLVGAAGVVGVQERRADDVDEPAVLSAPSGGAVGRMAMGGSGLGDAIVAWKQGDGDGAQIAATVVDAPPDPFLVLLPNDWQRAKRIEVAWDHALSAIGGVTYSVSVDDEPVVEGKRGLHARLGPDDAGDGRHRVQIFALDDAGQETGSNTGQLRIDRRKPHLRLRRHGRRLTVIVTDGPPKATSGVRRGSVRASFGERRRGKRHAGRRAARSSVNRRSALRATARRRVRRAKKAARRRRAARRKRRVPIVKVRHVYSRPGRYRVEVRARDRAGNRVALRRTVRIR